MSRTELTANPAETRRLPAEKTGRKSAAMEAMEREAARIRWLLAINPNTPPPVLDQLAKDETPALLERIAENPKAHPLTLARLANHAHPQVRAAVAENANCSLKTIWRLTRDTSADVRMRVAEGYFVPLTILRVLAMDENPYVQDRANKTIARLLAEVGRLRLA